MEKTKFRRIFAGPAGLVPCAHGEEVEEVISQSSSAFAELSQIAIDDLSVDGKFEPEFINRFKMAWVKKNITSPVFQRAKLPFAIGVVKDLRLESQMAYATLTDDTGEIKIGIAPKLLKENECSFKTLCLVVLRNLSVLNIEPFDGEPHLHVKRSSVWKIYSKQWDFKQREFVRDASGKFVIQTTIVTPCTVDAVLKDVKDFDFQRNNNSVSVPTTRRSEPLSATRSSSSSAGGKWKRLSLLSSPSAPYQRTPGSPSSSGAQSRYRTPGVSSPRPTADTSTPVSSFQSTSLQSSPSSISGCLAFPSSSFETPASGPRNYLKQQHSPLRTNGVNVAANVSSFMNPCSVDQSVLEDLNKDDDFLLEAAETIEESQKVQEKRVPVPVETSLSCPTGKRTSSSKSDKAPVHWTDPLDVDDGFDELFQTLLEEDSV